MKKFFFKVLTYPKSVPMTVMANFDSEHCARLYAQELYRGTGPDVGTWVKVYASDPDECWLGVPTPLLELPEVAS